jgi:hypothetical protein
MMFSHRKLGLKSVRQMKEVHQFVDVIIRRRDVCGWAFVYRKKVDENSDHRQRYAFVLWTTHCKEASAEHRSTIRPSLGADD